MSNLKILTQNEKINQKLNVALVQKKASIDIKSNLKLGLEIMGEAKNKGADIVLFPELWSHSYNEPFPGAFEEPFNENNKKEREIWLDTAIDENSEYIKCFQKSAKDLSMGVAITYLSKGKHKPQNSVLMIDKNGDVLIKYSKVHTCDFSMEAMFECGKEFKVCDFHGIKIGVMICFDREFPEASRVLMLKGAEVILIPNACSMNPARLNQLSCRTFENMVGVAMANYPNIEWGNSCAFSPIVFDKNGHYIDNKIFQADAEEENIFIAEFDINEIRKWRKEEVWGNKFRKPDAYKILPK